MMYLLDFDRTLFNTNAFMRAAVSYCVALEVPKERPHAADFVYADARAFLAAHAGKDRLVILTSGEEQHQRAKVEASGLMQYVDELHIVQGLKGDAAVALATAAPQGESIVFVDDTIEQLLAVSLASPAVVCVRMRRPGAGYTSLPETPQDMPAHIGEHRLCSPMCAGMHELEDFATLDAHIQHLYGETHTRAS